MGLISYSNHLANFLLLKIKLVNWIRGQITWRDYMKFPYKHGNWISELFWISIESKLYIIHSHNSGSVEIKILLSFHAFYAYIEYFP